MLKAMCQCTRKPEPNPDELQDRTRSYFLEPIVCIISSFLKYILAEEAGKRLLWRCSHPLQAFLVRVRFVDLVIYEELNHRPLQPKHLESKLSADPWGLC